MSVDKNINYLKKQKRTVAYLLVVKHIMPYEWSACLFNFTRFLRQQTVFSFWLFLRVFHFSQVVQDEGVTKYSYNPTYTIKDRKALLNLLKRFDLHGEGGILMEDVEESLPHAQAALKKLGNCPEQKVELESHMSIETYLQSDNQIYTFSYAQKVDA